MSSHILQEVRFADAQESFFQGAKRFNIGSADQNEVNFQMLEIAYSGCELSDVGNAKETSIC